MNKQFVEKAEFGQGYWRILLVKVLAPKIMRMCVLSNRGHRFANTTLSWDAVSLKTRLKTASPVSLDKRYSFTRSTCTLPLLNRLHQFMSSRVYTEPEGRWPLVSNGGGNRMRTTGLGVWWSQLSFIQIPISIEFPAFSHVIEMGVRPLSRLRKIIKTTFSGWIAHEGATCRTHSRSGEIHCSLIVTPLDLLQISFARVGAPW